MEDPLGRLASVTSEEDFDVVAGVIDEAFDDFGEKFGGKLGGFLANAVGTEVFHNKLLSILIVSIMSLTVLPRERSAMGISKPWMMGPAMVKPPNCSRDLYRILPELRSGVMRMLA